MMTMMSHGSPTPPLEVVFRKLNSSLKLTGNSFECVICKLQTQHTRYLDVISWSFPYRLRQFSGWRVTSDQRGKENKRRMRRILIEDPKHVGTTEG